MKNYFKILDVDLNANYEKIYKNFINLATPYHPDNNNTKEALNKFLDLSEAYYILEDSNLKKVYTELYKKHILNKEETIRKEDEKLQKLDKWIKEGRSLGLKYSQKPIKKFKKIARKKTTIIGSIIDLILTIIGLN
jgi:DnaJ-class molecular chaperone